MPFDGSGNFSRLYSWQSDRDNGIHILASRMDGEFDNFAAGMNQVFFRNGLVPMSGNLNMGQNYITGLGAGSAAALPIRFGDDPNSGMFLNGYNRPSIVANGVTRLEANTTGVLVTGTLNSSGNMTENGSRVWTAATFTPGNYALLSGAAFTGGISGTSAAFSGTVGAASATFSGQANAGAFNTTGGAYYFNSSVAQAISSNGTSMSVSLPLAVTGALTATGTFNALGAITQAGAQVWHAGNFTPGNYALIGSSNIFTGLQTFRTGGEAVRLRGVTPYIQGYSDDLSTPYGYMQFNGATSILAAASGGSAQLSVSGSTNSIFVNSAGSSVTGPLNVTGALTQANNQVWHAGNLTPGNYAALAGATFTGTLIATAAEPIRVAGTAPYVQGYNAAQTVAYGSMGFTSSFSYLTAPPAGGTVKLISSGVDALVASSTGAAITGTLSATGAITQNGSQVWHAGNFTPSNYATLAGSPTFTGTPAAPTAAPGTNTTQIATTAFVVAGDALKASLTGANFTGAITQSGNQVWHAGNLTPSNYAALASGPTFTGNVTAPAFVVDSQHYLTMSGAVPVHLFDAGDFISYNRTTNKYFFNIGSTAVASIDSAGNLKVLGTVTAAAGTV